jgi:hypothetical protein
MVGEIGAINQSITFDPTGWAQSICHLNSLLDRGIDSQCHECEKTAKIPYFSTVWKEDINAMICKNASHLCAVRACFRAIYTGWRR